ncbi:MAG TPA: pitrilysin family protein [Gemmatimonadaceae bacterium]|nr:pitrilysin family protein [Gemmatimonadaceae bacterium]
MSLRRWLAAGVLGALSSAGAQTARPPRPEPLPERPFKFPNIKAHTLANGLRLLVVEDHSLPLVAVRAVLPVDSTADPAGREGLYAVAVGAMREGTTTRSAEQLANAFAELGRTVTPTGFTALAASFGRGLELMSDMLLHPRFDSAGVERRKALQASAATRQAQAPVTVPRQLFYAELYGAGDGYVRSLRPTAASVGAITPADVADFYARRIGPVGTTIVVAGDVSDGDALSAVTRLFGSWRSLVATVADGPSAPSARETTIYMHDAHSSQTYLYIGGRGPARGDRDAVAADIMSAVAASRMQQTLRDKRSFMYSGTMGVIWQRPPRAAALVGSTVVNAAKVDSALAEWVSLIRGLSTGATTTQMELDAARRLRVGSLPARIDGPDSLASRLGELARDALPIDYFDRYAAAADVVTTADLTSAASKYLDVNHLIIVVSGDRALLEPGLRAANVGPVVVVDSTGRPVVP